MEGLQDARHGFLGACEALLSLGEDETRAQGLVRDVAAACALFCTFATSLRTDVSLVPSSGLSSFCAYKDISYQFQTSTKQFSKDHRQGGLVIVEYSLSAKRLQLHTSSWGFAKGIPSVLARSVSFPETGDSAVGLTGFLHYPAGSEASQESLSVDVMENDGLSLQQDLDAIEVVSVPFDGGTNVSEKSEDSGSEEIINLERKDPETEFATWVEAVHACYGRAYRDLIGVKVTEKLDLMAPNLCASWLNSLKSLASSALVAQSLLVHGESLQGHASEGTVHERVRRKEGTSGTSNIVTDREVLDASRGFWSTGVLLTYVLPKLENRGGLRCARWRARVAATDLAAFLALHDLKAANDKGTALPLLEDLLQCLIYEVALADLEWQVRVAAVSAASKILEGAHGILSDATWATMTWGVLAACMDPQPDVQAAAVDSIFLQLLPPSSGHLEVVVQALLDRFITVAVAASESPENGLDRIAGGMSLIAAVTATIQLQLFPPEAQVLGKTRDRVPLLVVAASVAFEEAESRQHKVVALQLLRLIRSLGSYQASLLTMLDPKMPLYEGFTLARFYKGRGDIDERMATTLERVAATTTLKGLSAAFGAMGSTDTLLHTQITCGNRWPSLMKNQNMASKQLDAMQYITEVLQIPPELTRNYSDKAADEKVRKFFVWGKLILGISIIIIEKHEWTPQEACQRDDLILNLFLRLSAVASGIIELGGTWVDAEGLGPLARNGIICLSEALQEERNFCADGDTFRALSFAEGDVVRSVQSLVLKLLAAILSRLKGILKAGTTNVSEENLTKAGNNDDLPGAIVAAHQLTWCLNQVEQPNLVLHCEMVIRTVLISLDHYSPAVKRQAMKSFIHLAKNLNPSELGSYKDAILDAITRSLIGSEELWPTAVEAAVALVTQIEGRNPRGSWYGAIMKEMLVDLGRHRDDQGRRIVWLQVVTPQLEAMGIVLVAHFKSLLPLLFHWLRAHDETTQILVLSCLSTIITHTWPRISFHANRIQEELILTYKDAEKRNSSAEIFDAVDQVRRLLLLVAP